MGSDMYFNPPRDGRKLWEKVRDVEDTKDALQAKLYQYEKILKDKNAEIEALKIALRSVGQPQPSFIREV